MTNAATEFFDALAARGREPALAKATGTLRVDLTDGRRRTGAWLIAMDKGKVEVSRRRDGADCTIRLPEELFDGIVTGRVNAIAAVLRGAVQLEGDLRLVVLFQRLFPGPPGGAS
jgi:putative sterol carrier protein